MESLIGSALIEKDGKYLLINAKTGRARGLWNNPGGHMKDEPVYETARRETAEETGLDVKIGRLIGIYVSGQTRKYVYEAKIKGGTLSLPQGEIEEARWFSAGEVKRLQNVTFGALQSVLDYSSKKFNQEYTTDGIP